MLGDVSIMRLNAEKVENRNLMYLRGDTITLVGAK
jgi:hypothetical protein